MTQATFIPKPITLLDGSEGAGESRTTTLSRLHRTSFQVAISNLNGGTCTLEGSVDGENFIPISPVLEAGTDIIIDGFYRYVHLPPVVRAVSDVAGVIVKGSPT